mgnify:CR=1 FL=1
MKLELARYITQWSSVKYIRAETDCMMFIFCWHDVRFGTNKNLSLYTMDEERGLIRIVPSVVKYDTVWRQA